MKRPRLRKWAKWVCTLAAVLAVSAAVFSGFYDAEYLTFSNSGDTVWTVAISWGQIVVERMDGLSALPVKPPVGWSVDWSPHWFWGYSGEKNPYVLSVPWHAGVLYDKYMSSCVAGTSVLYPVALTLIPAALLWYADRRRFKPGACTKCGYDRSGLSESVKCPECGVIPSAPNPPSPCPP